MESWLSRGHSPPTTVARSGGSTSPPEGTQPRCPAAGRGATPLPQGTITGKWGENSGRPSSGARLQQHRALLFLRPYRLAAQYSGPVARAPPAPQRARENHPGPPPVPAQGPCGLCTHLVVLPPGCPRFLGHDRRQVGGNPGCPGSGVRLQPHRALLLPRLHHLAAQSSGPVHAAAAQVRRRRSSGVCSQHTRVPESSWLRPGPSGSNVSPRFPPVISDEPSAAQSSNSSRPPCMVAWPRPS
ncbi:hypothetical protein NDU88_002900 [Pleurodeles waltl]|uniref:Uncharacterized protein n=1 Tax=Pleurodeles waltl TaxID=8319 RepID=A0AAV7SD06_PLEWA|nr:hypothetical protein NDU88_002900 [Pleurodeles waltl]